MAEETQEKMSMDDILSSIKNILSNGAENKTTASTDISLSETDVSSINSDVSDSSSVDLALDDTDDGVLDLTADMRVSTPIDATSDAVKSAVDIPQESADINIGEELSAVSSEMPVPDVSIDAPTTQTIVEPEPVDLSAELSSVSRPLELSEPVSVSPLTSIPADDGASDPIYSPEEDNVSQPLYNQADNLINETPDVSPAISDFNIETIPVSSDTDPVFIAQEDIIDDNISTSEEPESDAADVSAQIINNFAKIFAGTQEPTEAPAPKISSQAKLGPDATIYDMVQMSIRNMLSPDMVKDIVSEADIKSYASEQVALQVKTWLNHNLPTMVEAIVKKEIERVMVKAGKN